MNPETMAAAPVCIHLRSKHYYMDLDFHPSGLDDGVPLPCWCLKTHQQFGPDSCAPTREDCLPGRPCYEPE